MGTPRLCRQVGFGLGVQFSRRSSDGSALARRRRTWIVLKIDCRLRVAGWWPIDGDHCQQHMEPEGRDKTRWAVTVVFAAIRPMLVVLGRLFGFREPIKRSVRRDAFRAGWLCMDMMSDGHALDNQGKRQHPSECELQRPPSCSVQCKKFPAHDARQARRGALRQGLSATRQDFALWWKFVGWTAREPRNELRRAFRPGTVRIG